MKPKGILFKGAMIRALLNTQVGVWPPQPIDPKKPYKGQTRRTIDPQPPCDCSYEINGAMTHALCFSAKPGVTTIPKLWVPPTATSTDHRLPCPYPVGTILYAKETFSADGAFGADGRKLYRADIANGKHPSGLKWKPSIFMPMVAARLWFEVVKVRVERVNQISEEDALLEGIPLDIESIRRNNYKQANAYRELWDSINGAGNFATGPFVWAYDIKRINKLEGLRVREFYHA